MACAAFMIIMNSKYKEKELNAYEEAGQIAQSVLTSIKTVNAFNLQKTFFQMYEINLKEVEVATVRKGRISGFFNGLIDALFIVIYGVSLLYSTYLIQNECETFSKGNILSTIFCVFHSFIELGDCLSFLSTLSQGNTFNIDI